MTKILMLFIVSSALLFAASSDKKNDRKNRVEKQIKKEMEKEKKYSKEKTFYQAKDYDFKSAEVNPDSLDSVPNIELQDDFDMDSVYD